VFPSARCDAKVEFSDGVIKNCSGWTFVDFRNAPSPNLLAFELRPHWPTALVGEGGDNNDPGPVVLSDQVAISAEGYSSGRGRLSVHGLQALTQAYYFWISAREALRYRLKASQNDITCLLQYVISLGPEQAANFSAMIFYSIVGLPAAKNNLITALGGPLEGHPITPLLQACLTPPPATKEQRDSGLKRILAKMISSGAQSASEAQ
jgi:hypothetical protein